MPILQGYPSHPETVPGFAELIRINWKNQTTQAAFLQKDIWGNSSILTSARFLQYIEESCTISHEFLKFS